jgi:hypothetical protein
MFIVNYAEDIIRGRNNIGERKTMSIKCEDVLHSYVKGMNEKYGLPSSPMGMLVWQNDTGDVFSFSIYKERKPFDGSLLTDVVKS